MKYFSKNIRDPPEWLHLCGSRSVDHEQPVGVLLQAVQHPELSDHHHNDGRHIDQNQALYCITVKISLEEGGGGRGGQYIRVIKRNVIQPRLA